jgi:tRNA pseudouridine55 synthase
MAKWEPVQVNGQPFTAGVVLVDKPTGISSFGVIRKIRRLLSVKKVGHAGTLDPFASGLLIVCAGRGATKNIDRFMDGRKSYRALIQLGVATETQDPEGEITAEKEVPELEQQEIETCLQQFEGPLMQAPPPFSAAKHKGKPLYHYARKGIMIEKAPKAIEIYSIVCLGYNLQAQQLDVEVVCSRGTYIRVLAADIGKQLGTCAHLQALRRTGSGNFTVDSSLSGEALDADNGLELLLEKMMTVEEALSPL